MLNTDALVPTRWGHLLIGNSTSFLIIAVLHSPSPHSLGTPIDWKPHQPIGPFGHHQQACPHSLGTPIDWKLFQHTTC